MSSAPQISIVDDAADLDALGGEWDALVLAAARPSPFLLHGWVTEWWRHLARGRSLAVVTSRRDGRLTGLLPLCIRNDHGVRTGEFLGGHESALADLLLAPGEPADTAPALMAAVSDLPLDVVDLFGLPASSPLIKAVPDGLLTIVERVAAPVMNMPDGFEAAYRERTTSKTRNTHKRRLKQLHGLGQVRFPVARTLDELEQALAEAQRLHALRWTGRPDGSEFVTSEGKAFHLAALRRIAPYGVPRIVLCEVDGRAVAHHYYFALDGRMYVHCLAFDPAFADRSVGLLTTLQALQVASEEGLVVAEFLGGDERYKLDLADATAPLHQAVGLTSGVRGRVAAARRQVEIAARVRLRKSPAVRRIYFRGLATVQRLRSRV